MHQQASNDLSRVGDEYRGLDRNSEQWRAMAQLGADATQRARAGLEEDTSFGPKRRRIRQAMEHRLAQARIRDFQGEDGAARAHAVARLLEDAADSEQPVAETIRLARTIDRELSQRAKQDDVADIVALVAFADERAGACLEQLPQPMRVDVAFCSAVHAVPSGLGFPLLECREKIVGQRATVAHDWMQAQPPKSSNLGVALDKQWSRLHRLVTERPDLQDKRPSADRAGVSDRCWVEGVCVCAASSRGPKLWKFRNNVIRTVKAAFPRNNQVMRQMLSCSEVFLQFSPVLLGDSAEELAIFFVFLGGGRAEDIPCLREWILPMVVVRGLMPKATGEWQPLCTALASFELCDIEWRLSFLMLQKHGRIIAEMLPKVVLVKALEACGMHSVWKHPSRRMGVRRASGDRHGNARLPQGAPSALIADGPAGTHRVEGAGNGATPSVEDREPPEVQGRLASIEDEEGASGLSGGGESDQALSDGDKSDSAPEEEQGADHELDCAGLSDDDLENADLDQVSDGIPEEAGEGDATAPPPSAASASAPSGGTRNPDHRAESSGGAPVAPPAGGTGRDVVLHLPGGSGRIAYYPRIQRFGATCPAWGSHGRRCRLTRTARPAAGANLLRKPFQGRCLGLLAAWCGLHDQLSAKDHLQYRPSKEARQRARRELMRRGPNLASE